MAAPADPVSEADNPRPPRSLLLAGFDAGQSHTTCRLALGDGEATMTARMAVL